METLLERLKEIGISAETLNVIRAADDDRAHECALLLIAMYDDRHEYLD